MNILIEKRTGDAVVTLMEQYSALPYRHGNTSILTIEHWLDAAGAPPRATLIFPVGVLLKNSSRGMNSTMLPPAK